MVCLSKKNLVERERPGEKDQVSLGNRRGWTELWWRVNFRTDSRLSCGRSGDGRERWRYSESVSFWWISCQFCLRHHLWHFPRAASHAAIQQGCFLLSPGSRPLGSGHLAATHCPSQPVLGVSTPQLQVLTLLRGFPCCSLQSRLIPQLHGILLEVVSIVKYRNVLGQWFSLFLIYLIANPFRKLALHIV